MFGLNKLLKKKTKKNGGNKTKRIKLRRRSQRGGSDWVCSCKKKGDSTAKLDNTLGNVPVSKQEAAPKAPAAGPKTPEKTPAAAPKAPEKAPAAGPKTPAAGPKAPEKTPAAGPKAPEKKYQDMTSEEKIALERAQLAKRQNKSAKRQATAAALSVSPPPVEPAKATPTDTKNLKGTAALNYLGTNSGSCKSIPGIKSFSKKQHDAVKAELQKDPQLTLEQACNKVKQFAVEQSKVEAAKPKSSAKKQNKENKTIGGNKTRKQSKKKYRKMTHKNKSHKSHKRNKRNKRNKKTKKLKKLKN
tara:strand:- start:255 stop:1157 length:903 start_codon:yes stop_codon:yes gene_type:complete